MWEIICLLFFVGYIHSDVCFQTGMSEKNCHGIASGCLLRSNWMDWLGEMCDFQAQCLYYENQHDYVCALSYRIYKKNIIWVIAVDLKSTQAAKLRLYGPSARFLIWSHHVDFHMKWAPNPNKHAKWLQHKKHFEISKPVTLLNKSRMWPESTGEWYDAACIDCTVPGLRACLFT